MFNVFLEEVEVLEVYVVFIVVEMFVVVFVV